MGPDRDFTNPADAVGLKDADRAIVAELYGVYRDRLPGNRCRALYYEDKQPLYNLGLAVPDDFTKSIKTDVGWAAKAVDALSARSVFDGVSALDPEVEDVLEIILKDNDLAGAYDRTKASELIHGCGFWTTHRDDSMASGVNLCYYDAEQAAAVWDTLQHRIRAGMVVGEYRTGDNGDREPSAMFVYTDTDEIILRMNADTKRWAVDAYLPHPMGRPPMVEMVYRPTNSKPFGKSRISRAVMSIVDEMSRAIVRAAVHAETYAAPGKYLLGVDPEEVNKSKFALYMDSFLTFGANHEGELPTVGQFAQSSMEPHISYMEHLANRMAAETSLPVATFGVAGNGYTSSDALRASMDDIILEAEAMNANNAKSLRTLLAMAYAIYTNRPFASLSVEERAIYIRWKSPLMPSLSTAADAMTKQASVVEWLPETSLFWEMLGYTDEQVTRLMSEKDAAKAAAQLNARLLGGGV